MRPRTLLVLLVLVAGLGSFIWFYERELPSSEERAKLEKRVLQVEKEDVTAITLQSESGTVRMEKVNLPAPAKQEKRDEEEIQEPETEWHLRQPLNARADAFAVDGLLDALTNLEQTRVLDDVDAKQAGLDKPRATVRLKTGKGETVLKIGAADPLGGSTLASIEGVEGREGAYVVSDSILNEIQKDPGDWRDRQMYRGDRDQVQRVKLSSGVVLVPKGEYFHLAGPVSDRADREKVDDLFAELSGLTAERFVNQPMGPARAVVEVAFKQGPPVRIEVGAPVSEEAVQARVGNQVFEARTRLAEIAARPAAEWRSQTLSGFDVFEVESATVQDGQGKLTLQRAEPDWKRGEETISYLPVSDFLFALVQARAERLLLPGELGIAGKPALTVTLKGKGSDEETVGEETLTLYPPVAAGVPARVSGRDLVLLLPAGTLGEIQGKLAEIRKAKPVQK